MSDSEFKDRLREALKGHDRQEVCDKIGRSLRAMTGWLNGANEPLASTVAALCLTLKVDADWLLGLRHRPKRRKAPTGW